MHPRRNSPGFVLFFADYSHEICGVGGGGGVGQQRSRALVHMRLLDEMCMCVTICLAVYLHDSSS